MWLFILTGLLAGRYARMRDAATSFILQTQQPVQGDSISSVDIRALWSGLYGLVYLTVNGAIGSNSNSEGPKKNQ